MTQRNDGGWTELVSLGDEQQVLEVVTATAYKLWDAVNTLTRLRPTKRSRYRVTIFGSARVPGDHWVYQAVRDLAAELARLDCVIVTGGGPGLMKAANEACISLIPRALKDQSASAWICRSSRRSTPS
jgi:hypothetical protein